MSFDSVQKHPRYAWRAPVDVQFASSVEKLPLENISLGGAFVRMATPPPKGSTVVLRLNTDIPLFGRVVHTIHENDSPRKSHPAGMGVQFESLSAETQRQLERLVDGLAAEAHRQQARKSSVRFVDGKTVHVRSEREVLKALWAESLKHGGLLAEGPAPPLGTQVRVLLGPLEIAAEVVQIIPSGGAGLQLKNLDGRKREALVRFVEGLSDSLVHREEKPLGPPLEMVLTSARRLFTGLEEDDPFGALGLPPSATEAEVKKRLESLRRMFAVPSPEATPPQRARIEAAGRALGRVEHDVLARVAALRKEAEIVAMPHAVVERESHAAARALLSEANMMSLRGDRVAARRAVLKALELVPDHEGAKVRLEALTKEIDTLRASDMLGTAEVMVQGMGMGEEAIKRAREAAHLSSDRTVRLRCVRILAKCSHTAEAMVLCEELVESNPRDVHALQALLHLYERSQTWDKAVRTGESLLRLRPQDDDLAKRVKKMAAQLRKS